MQSVRLTIVHPATAHAHWPNPAATGAVCCRASERTSQGSGKAPVVPVQFPHRCACVSPAAVGAVCCNQSRFLSLYPSGAPRMVPMKRHPAYTPADLIVHPISLQGQVPSAMMPASAPIWTRAASRSAGWPTATYSWFQRLQWQAHPQLAWPQQQLQCRLPPVVAVSRRQQAGPPQHHWGMPGRPCLDS